MKTVFLRALDAGVEEKAQAIREAIACPEDTQAKTRFEVAPEDFAAVPKSPFAYWVSDRLRKVFREHLPFESGNRAVKQGLATADDFRFVRLATEVQLSMQDVRWFPFAKGGKFSRFYAQVSLVVDWGDGARSIWANLNSKGTVRSNIWMLRDTSKNYFLRPGLTWPLRGIRFSSQTVPRGCVFSVAGKMAFADADDLGWLSAVFNSLAFDGFIAFFAGKIGGVQYEVGLIQKVPIPTISHDEQALLAQLARDSWSLNRYLDTISETSHAFALPALLQADGAGLVMRASVWNGSVSDALAERNRIQAEIDDRCFTLYGITDEDRSSIERGFGAKTDVEDDESDESEAPPPTDPAPLVQQLLSWSLGAALGRFDLRLATGDRPEPAEPEPFDPLPVCSPGMLTGEDGLPLTAPPEGYPIAFPEDGILVDDPGHPRDITAGARAVFDVVFDDGNARWHEAAELVGARGQDLRAWFARDLFAAHIKTYSKSRRKAPIYWQLGTPSNVYSVWIYYHRLSRDTFFRVINDHVAPKLDHEEDKLTALRQEAGTDPSSKQRKAIDTQEMFVGELRTLKTEAARIAPLWNPDLNDGVIINFAPWWRLVPQHKSWQKECKKVWDALIKGDYDWAHLAMHLWPERVVPKCWDDRSLAIAHGLEEDFWTEDDDGKWHQRAANHDRVADLISERASTAVKAALNDLLSAPTPGGGRTRRSRIRRGAA
jgi:hypothetical protein